ncbi:MAG: hypothetical protein AAB890_01150 [Patescibacteria group bacterium]
MFKTDIRLEVTYNIKTNEIVIRANANKKVVRKVLEDFLLSEADRKKDHTMMNVREEYKIVLELDLKNDDRRICSVIGNTSVEEQIFVLVLLELKQLKILPIQE